MGRERAGALVRTFREETPEETTPEEI